MTTVERATTVAAGVDVVWARLADFGSISSWAPDVDHSCLMSEQTSGVGMVRRVQVGRLTLVETVVEWEPPNILAYEITGLPPIVTVTNEWRLEASGPATLVTVATRVDGGHRPPQRLVAKAIATRMAKASEAMLAGLDTTVTGRAAQPTGGTGDQP